MLSAFAIVVAAAAVTAGPPARAVPWSPAPPPRPSLHFEGIWQSPLPLNRDTRVLFGDRLLGFAGTRAGTTDGLGFFLLDRDRGRVLDRIAAPGAQTTVLHDGDDDLLVVWRRPGEVEEAEKTPCGLAAYDPRRLRRVWRHKACDFLDPADDRRLAVALAGKHLLLLAALHTDLAPDADQPTALVAVTASTGQPAWRLEGPPRVGAVSGGGDHFYLAARDTVWALDPATGRTLWQSARASGADPTPANDADLPVALTTAAGDDPFMAAGNTVGRLDGATGRAHWERSLPGAGAIVALVERKETLFVVSYRDSFEGSLVALDAITGTIRWARELWQPAIIGAVPEGLLATCTVEGSDHRLSVLDAADGAALAQLDLGESSSGPSAIAGADGYLVVRRGEGGLTGLRLRSGAEDAPRATARLAGAVEVCYRRRCSRRAGLDVRVIGAEPGAKAETVVTAAGGRFAVPLRRGRLVTASVDKANLRSIAEALTREVPARDASLPDLAGEVRCYGNDPSTIVATRDGETVHVVLRIDCRIQVRD